MDAVQAAAGVVQAVQALLQGVQAVARAARDARQAGKRVAAMEELLSGVCDSRRQLAAELGSKLHHAELEARLASLDRLISSIQPHILRAQRMAAKQRRRGALGIYLTALAAPLTGDDLAAAAEAVAALLNQWIQRHAVQDAVRDALQRPAARLEAYLRVEPPDGFSSAAKSGGGGLGFTPLSKATRVRQLLEAGTSSVVLIHGLSGMGKSCLARHVAADPPPRFRHGAVDLVFGHACSHVAGKQEYRRRLTARLAQLLRRLGRARRDVATAVADLDDACELLQESLRGRSILLLLDDVWEADIIARFTRLYDNECAFIATTRNRSVYDAIAEADKVEIGKEDVQEVSLDILKHHSGLHDLPAEAAAELAERCGHHALTLAVLGKALRGEPRAEQWRRAAAEVAQYAAAAPLPSRYLVSSGNDDVEGEAASAATVFGSFGYGLRAMRAQARQLFESLAALQLEQGGVPEACLESMWSALQLTGSAFRIEVNALLDSSLLSWRGDGAGGEGVYVVHDMVALYLRATRPDVAVLALIRQSPPGPRAALLPWLCHLGCQLAVAAAEEEAASIFWSNSVELPTMLLWGVVDVVSACCSLTELEAAATRFSRMIGPEVPRLLLLDHPSLAAAVARCVANCFAASDYKMYSTAMLAAGAVEKLGALLRSYGSDEEEEMAVRRDAAAVLARLAESEEAEVGELPVEEMVALLEPGAEEEEQEVVVSSLARLARAGEEGAVRAMFKAGMAAKLETMLLLGNGDLESGTHQQALLLLKTFHELGGAELIGAFFLRSGVMTRLPWQSRLSLERLVGSNAGSPRPRVQRIIKSHVVQQLAILAEPGRCEQDKLAALQEVAKVIERAATAASSEDHQQQQQQQQQQQPAKQKQQQQQRQSGQSQKQQQQHQQQSQKQQQQHQQQSQKQQQQQQHRQQSQEQHQQQQQQSVVVMVVEALSELLARQQAETKLVKYEACIALAAAASGLSSSSSSSSSSIRVMIKRRVVETLVAMAVEPRWEMRETAVWTLRELLWSAGGRRAVTEQLLRANLLDKLMKMLEINHHHQNLLSKTRSSPAAAAAAKTRHKGDYEDEGGDNGDDTEMVELGVQLMLDLVEVGGKECLQRLLSMQLVEKLARCGTGREAVLLDLAKAVRRCTLLSPQEQRVLAQQLHHHARSVLRPGSSHLADLQSFLFRSRSSSISSSSSFISSSSSRSSSSRSSS